MERTRRGSANKPRSQIATKEYSTGSFRKREKKRTETSSTSGRCETDHTEKEHSKSARAIGRWHGPERLSKKFDRLKTGDPFQKSKSSSMSSFKHAYSNGVIPCRIDHGGVVSRLQWDRDPKDIDYDPLIITVASGLSETTHPHVFVSQNAFKELLQASGGKEKTIPLIPQIVRELRAAMLSKNDDTFTSALIATQQLSDAVGEHLTKHIGSNLLIQINKKYFNRKFKQRITETLLVLERNGGSSARHLIKKKIPLFN